MATRARITGTGMAVPECVVDNHLLSRCMSTTDEWIFQRTGIRERRVSPDTYQMLLRLAEAPDKTAYMREVKERGLDGNIDSSLAVSDLGLEASRMALKHAGLGAEDLDCIVESSTLPDLAYPGTGCVLQGKLGLTSTPVFNLAQGCAGFVYGLSLADQFIRGGMYRKVLVVGAELLSSAFDYTDAGRDMAVLFADGAGAAILEGHEEGMPARGLLSHHLHSDGSAIDALYGEIWGSSTFPLVSKKKIDDDRARPRMNGRVGVRERGEAGARGRPGMSRRQRLEVRRHRLLRLPPGQYPDHRGHGGVLRDSRIQDAQQHPALRQHRGGVRAHLPPRGGDGGAGEGERPRDAGRLRHRLLVGGDPAQVVRRPAC